MDNSLVSYDHFGKQDVAILDEDGLETCTFLNNFIYTTYGDAAFNTRYTYGLAALFVYRYFVSQNINLVQRAESGTFITSEEFDLFKRHCSFKMSSENDNTNILSFAKLSSKNIDNMIYNTQNAEGRVATQTIKSRLRQLQYYLEYLYNTFHSDNLPSTKTEHQYSNIKRIIKRTIRKLKL